MDVAPLLQSNLGFQIPECVYCLMKINSPGYVSTAFYGGEILLLEKKMGLLGLAFSFTDIKV